MSSGKVVTAVSSCRGCKACICRKVCKAGERAIVNGARCSCACHRLCSCGRMKPSAAVAKPAVIQKKRKADVDDDQGDDEKGQVVYDEEDDEDWDGGANEEGDGDVEGDDDDAVEGEDEDGMEFSEADEIDQEEAEAEDEAVVPSEDDGDSISTTSPAKSKTSRLSKLVDDEAGENDADENDDDSEANEIEELENAELKEGAGFVIDDDQASDVDDERKVAVRNAKRIKKHREFEEEDDMKMERVAKAVVRRSLKKSEGGEVVVTPVKKQQQQQKAAASMTPDEAKLMKKLSARKRNSIEDDDDASDEDVPLASLSGCIAGSASKSVVRAPNPRSMALAAAQKPVTEESLTAAAANPKSKAAAVKNGPLVPPGVSVNQTSNVYRLGDTFSFQGSVYYITYIAKKSPFLRVYPVQMKQQLAYDELSTCALIPPGETIRSMPAYLRLVTLNSDVGMRSDRAQVFFFCVVPPIRSTQAGAAEPVVVLKTKREFDAVRAEMSHKEKRFITANAFKDEAHVNLCVSDGPNVKVPVYQMIIHPAYAKHALNCRKRRALKAMDGKIEEGVESDGDTEQVDAVEEKKQSVVSESPSKKSTTTTTTTNAKRRQPPSKRARTVLAEPDTTSGVATVEDTPIAEDAKKTGDSAEAVPSFSMEALEAVLDAKIASLKAAILEDVKVMVKGDDHERKELKALVVGAISKIDIIGNRIHPDNLEKLFSNASRSPKSPTVQPKEATAVDAKPTETKETPSVNEKKVAVDVPPKPVEEAKQQQQQPPATAAAQKQSNPTQSAAMISDAMKVLNNTQVKPQLERAAPLHLGAAGRNRPQQTTLNLQKVQTAASAASATSVSPKQPAPAPAPVPAAKPTAGDKMQTDDFDDDHLFQCGS